MGATGTPRALLGAPGLLGSSWLGAAVAGSVPGPQLPSRRSRGLLCVRSATQNPTAQAPFPGGLGFSGFALTPRARPTRAPLAQQRGLLPMPKHPQTPSQARCDLGGRQRPRDLAARPRPV